MGKAFTDVTIEHQIERNIAEHEVFMSFVNDSDAVAFHVWWDESGSAAFKKWIDSKED